MLDGDHTTKLLFWAEQHPQEWVQEGPSKVALKSDLRLVVVAYPRFFGARFALVTGRDMVNHRGAPLTKRARDTRRGEGAFLEGKGSTPQQAVKLLMEHMGGLVREIVEVGSLFTPRGMVVEVRGPERALSQSGRDRGPERVLSQSERDLGYRGIGHDGF